MSEFTPQRGVLETKPIKDITDTLGVVRGDRVQMLVEGNVLDARPVRRADGTVELVKRIEIDRTRSIEIVSRL